MHSDKRIYHLIPSNNEENLPFLFESPHSGTFHPEDGDEHIASGKVFPGVDRFVDELFAFVPDMGAPLIHADFCRCYIDPNRALDDMRPEWFDAPWPHPLNPSEKSANGIGLIWPKKCGITHSPDDIQSRIDRFYRPYHQIIRGEIDRLHKQFGHALHISCHSAPHKIMKPQINPRVNYTADIVISDQFGQTADARIGRALRNLFESKGYKTLSNDPFQGDELIRAHGSPQNNRHSIQIEINRALYMDEAKIKRSAKKFSKLQTDLHEIFMQLHKAYPLT